MCISKIMIDFYIINIICTYIVYNNIVDFLSINQLYLKN